MALADFGTAFAEPGGDDVEFGRFAGKVGVTTGRLATAGVSTMPRLLEVDTTEGFGWLDAGNALGIELTRGIEAMLPVGWFNPGEDGATGLTAAGDEATDVPVGAGLLASNELGGGGTAAIDDEVAGAAEDAAAEVAATFAGTAVAYAAIDGVAIVGLAIDGAEGDGVESDGVAFDSDGTIAGVTATACGGRGIGAETRGYSGTFGGLNTTAVASGVDVGTGSFAATLTSAVLVSESLSSVGEFTAALFASLGLGVFGVAGSAARATVALGTGATFEIVSPPIRIACGIENSPP
jgi:hypothetical protein